MATDNRRSNLGELEQSAANNPRSGTVPHYGGRYQAGSMTGTSRASSNYPHIDSNKALPVPDDEDDENDYSYYSDYSPGSNYFDRLAKGGNNNLDDLDQGSNEEEEGGGGSDFDIRDRNSEDKDSRNEPQRDLGTRERDASIDSSGFNNRSEGGGSSGKDGARSSKSSSAAKSGGSNSAKGAKSSSGSSDSDLMAQLIATVILAAILMIAFIIIAVVQLVQSSEIIKAAGTAASVAQQAVRTFDNVREVVGSAVDGIKDFVSDGSSVNSTSSNSTVTALSSGNKSSGVTGVGMSTSGAISDRVKQSRMGVLSQKYARKLVDDLGKNGAAFSSDGGIEIDPILLGATPSHLERSGDFVRNSTATILGIDKNKVQIKGKRIYVSKDLSYSEIRRLISFIDDPGKWNVSGWLGTRLAMKRNGYTRWLHPVQKSKNDLYDKFQDWIKDQFSNVPSNGKYLQTVAGTAGSASGDVGGITRVVNQLKQERQKVAEDNPEYTRSRVNSIIDKLKQFETFINSAMKMNGFKTTGLTIIVFMASFVCMISKIYDSLGQFKYSNIVVPAEKEAGLYLGYASQLMSLSGDMSVRALDLVNKTMVGDSVPELDSNGEPTGKMVHSNFIDAPAVSKFIGIIGNDKINDNSGMQGILKTVGKPGFNFLPGRMNGMLNSLYTQYKNMVDVVCGIIDILFSGPLKNITEAIIDFIVSLVKKQFEALIANLFASNDEFWQVLTVMANWLVGQPLTTDIANPIEHGSNAMFGGKFLANDQAMITGGRRLNDKEAIELNLENRRYLAWKHDRKPLLAKLFDPFDYSSALSQVAYAANASMGKRSISVALSNTIKTILSAPTIMATASNQLLGNSAYAASAYDFGVPTYGRSVDEMNEMISDDSQGLFNNADKAISLFQIPPPPNRENPYIEYARDCLLTEINKSDYSAKPVDNSEGNSFNYADSSDEETEGKSTKWRECDQKANQADYRSVRNYIMDYYNIVSIACYHGDDGDSESGAACKEMQVDDVSSGSKSSADGSGNVEATEMQKKFADETHGHYGAYSTSSNGCTTVTAWFIGEHTTLTYGHGNGNQVVKQLIAANPGKNLKSEPYPTKAPAIFSSVAGHMHASGGAGHTGVVTSVDPTTGTIHTLESGANNSMNGLSPPWSKTFEWKKEDYSSGVEFVYVGDYLK